MGARRQSRKKDLTPSRQSFREIIDKRVPACCVVVPRHRPWCSSWICYPALLKASNWLTRCPRHPTAVAQLFKVGISLLLVQPLESLRSELAAWGSASLGFRLCCAIPEPQRIGAGIKPPSRGRATRLVPSLGGFGNLASRPHCRLRPNHHWSIGHRTPLLNDGCQLAHTFPASPRSYSSCLSRSHQRWDGSLLTTQPARVLTRAGSSTSWVCNFFAAVPGC